MTTIHPFVVNKNKKIDITTTPIETIPSYKFFFLSSTKNASKTETENRNENNQQVQKKQIKRLIRRKEGKLKLNNKFII